MKSTSVASSRPRSLPRRIAGWLERRPRVRLGLLLAGPVAWLGLAYLGSLLILFVNAFWARDAFTGQVVREFTLDNFVQLATPEVYRTITLRTLVTAAAVTITCAVLALPIAYYMARVASARTRAALVVAVVIPLWASYLVKVYSWRLIIAEDGVLNWLIEPFGMKFPGPGDLAVYLVFVYLWLPYMILPVFAAIERIPGSYLEASADLGARGGLTFRRIVLPLALPGLVAGSIFTFSLTLGDYIVPSLVSTTQFIGSVILSQVGPAGNLPFAAAYSMVPLAIMLVYLLLARRLGAFDAL
jgi:putative spermidine/putrescine transport system permease protein